ncbi:hypothetical protein [Lentzea flaviverrucosa]|uniref:Uncharacterized protein n=2 Tax=Lentzea flaviverrucosa TaxID=200379 RepID=A0A1H9RF20_9PSEU|nr:hypothetical protein [Lentzea flaviverrucosa]RDI32981.1 hypothetical protein DFR72_102229 [Lentzea flaviverrucosa]SER71282.1 hypothetical protein SAMN05216195_106230 [Lentzea flaviverrucosa]
MMRAQSLAAVTMVAVLALQPPSSTEPPPSSDPGSSSPAPTSTTTSEPPPVSSTSTTPPPVSSTAPTPPPSADPPPPPPPAPAPVAAGGREWTLTASRLDLGGLNFVGIVDTLLNGQVVKVLKFTASDMKIKDLVQTAEVSPGVKLITAARPGSTSTVSPGRIELFTVQLKGNLDILGIKIPVDYTAAHPPPLNVPFVTFTEVTVRNTDLIGGTLKIPGARISVVSDQAPVARR